MKVVMKFYLGSNEKKNSGKELNKIEARLAESNQKMNNNNIIIKTIIIIIIIMNNLKIKC